MRDLGDLTEASRLLPQALKTIKDLLGSKNVMFAEILGKDRQTFISYSSLYTYRLIQSNKHIIPY